MIRLSEQKLEYFVLGDSSLCIYTNSTLDHICDRRLQQIGSPIRSSISSLLKEGHGYMSPEIKQQKQTLLALQNQLRNHKDGYFIVSLDPDAAEHALIGEKPLPSQKNWTIALMTDGLSRLVDTFEVISSWENLLRYLAETPAIQVIERIRAIEYADPNGQKYPRFHKHDDASMLMIQNT
ncbi:hypothetical protein MK805_01140 [Shimazuella sp. AN120528]|uniref:hypothetical protein n=1 Tax=Shimazuella soli TaxID=1892854 RepID=UPI001F0F0D5C|nr:hypothetical protein [Shimazuella soli]MCH5583575.1 hypothetical protein [Shimazuella soli]